MGGPLLGYVALARARGREGPRGPGWRPGFCPRWPVDPVSLAARAHPEFAGAANPGHLPVLSCSPTSTCCRASSCRCPPSATRGSTCTSRPAILGGARGPRGAAPWGRGPRSPLDFVGPELAPALQNLEGPSGPSPLGSRAPAPSSVPLQRLGVCTHLRRAAPAAAELSALLLPPTLLPQLHLPGHSP